MATALSQTNTAFGIRFADQSIEPHDLADFWPKLMQGQITQDALVTFSELKNDFPHWEMHPNGEELFVLVTGCIDVTLEMSEGEVTTRMNAGDCLVIPRGIWHRASVVEPGRLIFLTFGEGTEHRPLESS